LEFPDQLFLGVFEVEQHGTPLDLSPGKTSNPVYRAIAENSKECSGHISISDLISEHEMRDKITKIPPANCLGKPFHSKHAFFAQ
jgi:hypothetical protein